MTEHETDDPGTAATPGPSTTTDTSGSPLQRASIRRNMAHMASAQTITWALTLSMAVVVPRYLGPDAQGVVQLSASLWAVAAILTFGTTTYLQLEIARRPEQGLSLVGTVLMLRTIGLLVAAIGFAAYVSVAGSGRTFAIVMIIVGASTAITAWTDAYSAVFVGLERMAAPALTSVLTKSLTVAGILTAVALDRGLYGVLAAGVIASTAGLGVLVRRFHDIGRTRFVGWKRNIVPVMIASLAFTGLSVANTVYRQIDVIVISSVASNRDVGWYASADVIIGTLLFPATIVLASAFPSFGRLHMTDPRALEDLVRKTYSMLMLVAVPIGVGIALVGPTFAPLLLGDDFSGTGEILVVMGPVLIFTFGTTLLSQVALVIGRGTFWTILLFGMAGLTIPLDLILVPWASERFDNGGIGGGLAYVVTESLQFVVGILVIARYLLARQIVWRTTRVLIAGGLMCAAVWPFRQAFFVVPVAIGAAVYAISVLLLRVFDDYERELLRSTLARLGLRGR